MSQTILKSKPSAASKENLEAAETRSGAPARCPGPQQKELLETLVSLAFWWQEDRLVSHDQTLHRSL